MSPSARRRVLRSSAMRALLLIVLGGGARFCERVIVGEWMRRDMQIPDTRVVGQHGVERRRRALGTALLIEQMSDGGSARRAARERLAKGGVERIVAVAVEQLEQAAGRAAEMAAAQGDSLEECRGARAGAAEAVPSPQLAGVSLRFGEGGDVLSRLDLPGAIVTAVMPRDLAVPVDEADHRRGGDERERPPDQRVGDGVVVEIESDIRGLARGDRPDEVAGERVLGQRQEASLLLGEGVPYEPAIGVAGDEAGVSRALNPILELRVEILDGSEGASGEEGVAQVLNRALDLALLVATRHGAGLGSEVVVAGELEELGVEAEEIPIALEDGAFKIVIEERARHASKRLEGEHVAVEKALEALVEEETGEDRARRTQDHHEARQRPLRAPYRDTPEAGPIYLRLLAGERPET